MLAFVLECLGDFASLCEVEEERFGSIEVISSDIIDNEKCNVIVYLKFSTGIFDFKKGFSK